MARRKQGGGRVTPKGTAPGGPLRVAHDIPPDLMAALPVFDHELALDRDAEASIFAAAFVADDPDVVDLRDDPDCVTATMMVDILASFGPILPQEAIDALAVLTVYGDATGHARRALRTLRPRPSARTEVFGRGEVIGALEVLDILGERTQYLFELRYPDGTTGVVGVLIEHLMGGLVTDALLVDRMKSFTEAADEAGDVTYGPVDVAVAAAHIDEALWFTEHVMGADGIMSDEVQGLRPMIERILASLPRRPRERTPVPPTERQALVDEFGHWVRANHPEVDTDTVSWASLAVDFAADHGTGDPLKWAPNTILSFLEWSARTAEGHPDELRRIPQMLRVFVPWAHLRMDWDDEHLPVALAALDDAMPAFEESVAGTADKPDRPQGGSSYVLRCSLESADTWRLVVVPSSITLHELHRVLVDAFEWSGRYRHEFDIGARTYTTEDEDWYPLDGRYDDEHVALDSIVLRGHDFVYRYDMSNDADMQITVVDELDPDPTRPPVDLLDGGGDSPPEDCGDVGHFARLVEVLTDPDGFDPDDPDHEDIDGWDDGFEPVPFDLQRVAARVRSRERR